MAVTEKTSGSVVLDGTEQQLAQINDAGAYQINVNLLNLLDGDDVTVRVKMKTRTTSNFDWMHTYNFGNIQEDPVKALIPVMSAHGLEITIERTAGGNRTVEWSVFEAG